jgi:hypothetical protein
MEWEKHRGPLISKYRRRKQGMDSRKSEVGIKVDQIKRMRAEMKAKAKELREKDEIHKQVVQELSKMPKAINRQVYVRRIMDIMRYGKHIILTLIATSFIRNLDRQKVDIKKVLEDIRQIQKDINSVSETSKRSFSVADEIIFHTAKSDKKKNATDDASKEAYKGVAAFLLLCAPLSQTGGPVERRLRVTRQVCGRNGPNQKRDSGRQFPDRSFGVSQHALQHGAGGRRPQGCEERECLSHQEAKKEVEQRLKQQGRQR